MPLKPSDPYYGEFTTASFSTGAATTADSLPVATATKNGADDGTFTLTVALIDTGRYKVTGTVPAGYAKGDQVQVCVAATVGGVAGKGVIDGFVIDSKRVGDLIDAAAAPTAVQVRTEMDTNSTKLANLDAAVSTRSTFAGGTVTGVTNPVTVDMTQAVPTTGNTANTLGDCLNASRAQGFGKWTKTGTTLTLYAADGTTVVRTFTLDDPTNPTSRS